MSNRQKPTVATILLLALTGCASGGQQAEFEAPDFNEPLIVQVHNDNYLDVVVYAMPDGQSVRLGDVTGSSSRELEIPRSVDPWSRALRLLVSPIGSPEAYLSETIVASPGDVIILRVSSVVGMSSWSLQRRDIPQP